MKPFRDRFNDYRESVSGLTSLAEQSFLFWSENFVNKKSELNPFNLLTGKIYSFEYKDTLDKKKKFINKRPIVFFTGFTGFKDKLTFGGIDLVLMPPTIRIAFFTRIQSVYSEQIESNMSRIEKGGMLDQIQLKTDYEILDRILTGIPFKNCYRSWDTTKVRDILEISYDDWTKIVYLYTRSVEGAQIDEIYKKNSII